MQKNNKLFAIVGIALIVLVFGLLVIPQFMYFKGYTYNGYEAIFVATGNPMKDYIKKNADEAHASAALIIALILMVFSGVSLLFQKKSSLLALFGGLFLAIAGLLFLLTPLWFLVIFNSGRAVSAKWLAYVVGGLMLAYGAFLTFLAIMRLRDEKNTLSSPKSHQYSYLKK
jgi:hypothetical protein